MVTILPCLSVAFHRHADWHHPLDSQRLPGRHQDMQQRNCLNPTGWLVLHLIHTGSLDIYICYIKICIVIYYIMLLSSTATSNGLDSEILNEINGLDENLGIVLTPWFESPSSLPKFWQRSLAARLWGWQIWTPKRNTSRLPSLVLSALASLSQQILVRCLWSFWPLICFRIP